MAVAEADKISAPFRTVEYPPVDLDVRRRDDGTILIATREELELAVTNVPRALMQAAARWPDRTALAERGPDGQWRRTSYRDFVADVRGCAQWLLDRGTQGPVMIASGNSVAHATLRYAAWCAGLPVAPLSENYVLLGAASDYEKLRHAQDMIGAEVVFAQGAPHVEAVRHCMPDACIVTCADGGPGDAMAFDVIRATRVTDRVDAAIDAITPATHSAYMLTSGSTGMPKAVIHTHGMMNSCVSQNTWTLRRTRIWESDVLVWLPWSHVIGFYWSVPSQIFGGSYYIDEGRPLPGQSEATIRNIKDLELTTFVSVPIGYTMLAEAMERDTALRDHFFARMKVLVYGGASLPRPICDRLQALAVAATGRRIVISSGYGATETTGGCMWSYLQTDVSSIGLPRPGVKLKLVPLDDRFELRVKGPFVMSGYLGQAGASAGLFDDEGYYMIGDTVDFMDPRDPARGLRFAGRASEDFKLASGTWVRGGELRSDLLRTLAPHVSEVLVCGEGHDRIGILAWPSEAGRQADPAQLRARIEAFNADNRSSSRRIRRFAWLDEPPAMATGEVSDKGSVNQKLAMRRRAADVDALYADPAPEHVTAF